LERRLLGPDQREMAVTAYDLAILTAKRGNTDEMFSVLTQAVDHGLPARVGVHTGEDPDLNPLHNGPRFAALVARAKGVPATPQAGSAS